MTRPLVNHLREPLGSLLSAFKTILLQSKQGFPLFLTTTLSESVNPRPFFSLLDMRIIYSKLSSVVKAVLIVFTTTAVETVLTPLVAGFTQSLSMKGDCHVSTTIIAT